MKNIIKLIINFFKKLFGIKTEKNKPQTVPCLRKLKRD
jgi:hypothetical protein